MAYRSSALTSIAAQGFQHLPGVRAAAQGGLTLGQLLGPAVNPPLHHAGQEDTIIAAIKAAVAEVQATPPQPDEMEAGIANSPSTARPAPPPPPPRRRTALCGGWTRCSTCRWGRPRPRRPQSPPFPAPAATPTFSTTAQRGPNVALACLLQ